MSEHLVEYFYYVFVIFSLVILTVISGFIINDFINSSSYDEKLESFCNQLHDTHSCSIVYENDDVVLFDTYNGYVTMENILK